MSIEAYKALAALVLFERPIEEILSEITGIAQRWVPGAEATSITLVRGDQAWTAAYTGRMARDADELQYADGYGPCMDAGRTGMPMVVKDMRAELRWPTYTPHVVKQGVLSSLSVPLPFQSTTIGALNNYSSQASAFGDDAMEFALEITSSIGIAVMNADAHAETANTARQMREALESRKVIDMALGILIATHHCTSEEAFAIMSRTSQTHNRKLRDLARALVDDESKSARAS